MSSVSTHSCHSSLLFIRPTQLFLRDVMVVVKVRVKLSLIRGDLKNTHSPPQLFSSFLTLRMETIYSIFHQLSSSYIIDLSSSNSLVIIINTLLSCTLNPNNSQGFPLPFTSLHTSHPSTVSSTTLTSAWKGFVHRLYKIVFNISRLWKPSDLVDFQPTREVCIHCSSSR